MINTALLQLVGFPPPTQPIHPPAIRALSDEDRRRYDISVQCIEELAVYLKYPGNGSAGGSRLTGPMQRKLVTLVQCALSEEEGRSRAYRAARSLGERTVTELILQHQNPQQLSANLWAAVRARGCQFLGPAMQEEVLKLVLLALEDGSALSRKVLVMFVVQRLEPHFPQASKTSIGHVVQLLYRASCFKVSKRESDSSLMQLKEEFRTYESLRREHDAQIVQIATEAGLRIARDQWSALLYGDTAHKSHMQSIIDKLQTPQSFAQSVQELMIALQRTGDPARLGIIGPHLELLAAIDPSPEAGAPTWNALATALEAVRVVVVGLVHFSWQHGNVNRDSNHNHTHSHHKSATMNKVPPHLPIPSNERVSESHPGQPHHSTRMHIPPPPLAAPPLMSMPPDIPTAALQTHSTPLPQQTSPSHTKYKVWMCRDAVIRGVCPRGESCTFAHTDDELEKYRSRNRKNNHRLSTGNNTARPESFAGTTENMFYHQNHVPVRPDVNYPMQIPDKNMKTNPYVNNMPGLPPHQQFGSVNKDHDQMTRLQMKLYGYNNNFNDVGQTGYPMPPNFAGTANLPPHPSQSGMMDAAVLLQTSYHQPQDHCMAMLLPSDTNGSLNMNRGHIQDLNSSQTIDHIPMLSSDYDKPNVNSTLAAMYKKDTQDFMSQLEQSCNDMNQSGHQPSVFPINSAIHQDVFVRSDSILTDDDYVPYEAAPASKYGPISRFGGARPPTGLPPGGAAWAGGPFLARGHSLFQFDNMVQALPIIENVATQENANAEPSTSNQMDCNLQPVPAVTKPSLNDKACAPDNERLGIIDQNLNEHNNAHCPLQIVGDIFTNDRSVSSNKSIRPGLNQAKLLNLPYDSDTEEDTYEVGIAKDMRELELKWEYELQEAEKRWSSEDENQK